jgi:GT2 family glycosyltransferase
MSALCSLIIPVFNRAALSRRCLEAVLATVPEDVEVLVVDDGSTDETVATLGTFGEAIRVLTISHNGGFANACNRGAAEASGDLLVFLNNDTEPRPGWLEALANYAEKHPQADVIGAKLLYPNGSVQHAGVVFGQDGYPHHLYAGLPGDHPAVNQSRPLQAVTAACALVRRPAFEQAGGFDVAYENSLEDVDLCLRVRSQGGEVHYCHRAEVVHLESASRGRSDRFQTSVELYRERWRTSVHRDDLEVYAADGLLSVEYPDTYPLRIAISPLLSIVDRGREEEIERLLEGYARQVSDLLQEVVRLTASLSGIATDEGPALGLPAGPRSSLHADRGDHAALLAHASWLEEEIRTLQLEAARQGNGVEAGPRLGYRHLVERIRLTVEQTVPAGATVLVISRGDRALLSFESRTGKHFPQGEDGDYVGHHPATSAEAIEQLEGLRARGAGFLVVPRTASWWLDHYEAFATHLRTQHRHLASGACEIYELRASPVSADPNRIPA